MANMIVSLANSFRFWRVDNNIPEFDNKPYKDNYNLNFLVEHGLSVSV